MVTITQQFDTFINHLAVRKRRPVKLSTIASARSLYNNWIGPVIGRVDLANVENPTIKTIVDKMAAADMAPGSIRQVTGLVKAIVKSATDKSGNALYRPVWNAEFIDAPSVNAKDQDAPTISQRDLQTAINKADAEIQPLLVLLAATGLRIAEALALRAAPNAETSYWDRDNSKLVIRTQIHKGLDISPKTAAGVREVDLAPQVNDYLKSLIVVLNPDKVSDKEPYRLFPKPIDVYRRAVTGLLPGGSKFHSLRRFRITWLESISVPRGLAMFWTGHAATDTHEKYLRMGEDVKARKEWCEKAGVGFDIPKGAR